MCRSLPTESTLHVEYVDVNVCEWRCTVYLETRRGEVFSRQGDVGQQQWLAQQTGVGLDLDITLQGQTEPSTCCTCLREQVS